MTTHYLSLTVGGQYLHLAVSSPNAPSNLVATAVSTSEIDLTWTDNGGGPTGFQIDRATDNGFTQNLATINVGVVTSYQDTGLSNGTTYYYRVASVNSVGASATSSPHSGTTFSVGAPTNLVATAITDTHVGLTWDRADDSDTSIQIWRGPQGGTLSLLDTLPAHENVYNDRSCYPSSSYDYQIVAANSFGSSAPSPAATPTTPANAATRAAPTSVSVAALSSYSLAISFTDPNDGGASRKFIIERAPVDGSGNIGAFTIRKTLSAQVAGGTTTWNDGELAANTGNMVADYDYVPLQPNTTYAYRIRVITADPSYGAFCSVVTGTTNSRPAGQPAEPSGVTATATSDVAATISFTDNSAGTAQHEIYTAPVPGAGLPYGATWTLKTTLLAGTTTYTLATTAKNAYYVRVRAKNGSQFSGYTSPVILVTPSTPNISGPQTYDIGVGQTYTSIGALPWSQVGPGDTIRIHGMNSGASQLPYFEKFLISCRGTQSAPITIIGINDINGNQCVIDGTNATTNNQFSYPNSYIYQDGSVILFHHASGANNGYRPGWIVFKDLEVRNGYQGDTGSPANQYTASDGTTRFYGGNATASASGTAAGIDFASGDNITIDSCTVHANGDGIFGDDQGGFGGNSGFDLSRLENLTFQYNYIYGNGTYDPGATPINYRQHNSYMECRGITYQYNRYGDVRTGTAGAALKDRSHNAIIRYNYIDGGAVRLDLVESQNHDAVAYASGDGYNKTYMYGNVIALVTNPANCGTLIVYGGDSANDPAYRQGILYSAHNTFVILCDQNINSRIILFKGALNGGPSSGMFDSRNDVIYVASPDAGTVAPTYYFNDYGVIRFGSGWVSTSVGSNYAAGGVAAVNGSSHLLNATSNTPNFSNQSTGDYRPTASSPFLNVGVALAGSMPTAVDHEYIMHEQSQVRSVVSGAADLGYYEYGT